MKRIKVTFWGVLALLSALWLAADPEQRRPGHEAGQFAFMTTHESEGAHPFTIAPGWNSIAPRLTFVAKELGDFTRRLPEILHVGRPVTVEGPYGCFTFDDEHPRQVWIGGGIGITPFIARMKEAHE